MFQSKQSFQSSLFGAFAYGKILERHHDHLLMRMQRTIDFSFIIPLVAGCYSPLGRKAYDPVCMVKLLVLQTLYDCSGRKRRKRCQVPFLGCYAKRNTALAMRPRQFSRSRKLTGSTFSLDYFVGGWRKLICCYTPPRVRGAARNQSTPKSTGSRNSRVSRTRSSVSLGTRGFKPRQRRGLVVPLKRGDNERANLVKRGGSWQMQQPMLP